MDRELELYIHIPFCVKKCNYCDFLSFSSDQKTQEDYVNALIWEIHYYGLLMKDRVVSTIYIGGGTPSWLAYERMEEILSAIYQNFQIAPDAEVSMECNPGTVTKESLQSYFSAGINRLSIGLQSADNEELRLLGRIHTFEQFVKTYEMARNTGFTNLNVDLISGLPYQNTEKFMDTLHKVIHFQPEHISAYTLIIEKGTPFYDQYKFDAVRQEAGMKTEVLPTEDEAYRIYKMTQLTLKEAGYMQYEISNYAKAGHACRHNIGYWKRTDYLGLGLGASSLIDNVRYTNTADLFTYINETQNIQMKELEYEDREGNQKKVLGTSIHADGQLLDRKSQMEEFMFLGLRMNEGISREEFQEAFHIPIEVVYRNVLEELKQEELLEMHAGRIYLTEKGMDLSNYAMAKFLF